MDLTDAETARYACQLALPGFGAAGQDALRSARVHVVGAGPVAGPALLYLAQAGVGAIYVDDAQDVADGDAAAWLYTPGQAGEPRLLAAMEAVRRISALVKVRPYATGADLTATLVCPPTPSIARTAAERARLAGVPHVVARADADGGEVVTIPSGAPCYSCASRPSAALPGSGPAAAAIGALAALELLLVVGGVRRGSGTGRRLEVDALGEPVARPTERRPGCDCANVY